MKAKNRFIFLAIFLSFIFSQQIFSQAQSFDDNFQQALQEYINKNLLRFGKNEIARERFLIQQMRDINAEIKSRVKNVSAVRDQYFAGLLTRLEELDAFRNRLSDYNSASLNAFIDQLDNRIRETIDQGEINYRRQKIFEDGIQVLYIAEEMLKLDPGAQLDGNAQLNQQLTSSNQKLLNSFGDARGSESPVSYSPSSGKATIWDLFVEWKRANSLQFEARWTDIEVIKNRLLKNGTSMEKDRMFKRELNSALLAYNFRNYDLSDRLLGEILTRYTFINTLDDIYFYKGETNFQIDRFKAASEAYLNLVNNFPTSPYTFKAYARLVAISHHFGDLQKVDQYYSEFEKVIISTDPLVDEIRFIAAVSAVSRSAYEEAITILNNIMPASEFYIDGRYVLAQAYVGANKFDEAENVLLGVVNNYNTPPDYHFNIYLKLAYISYERGTFQQAIGYLDQIGNNFSLYDRVLMAYGWNHYKEELLKEDKVRNFEITKRYLSILMSEFPNSDYFLEAKSLLAYIYQLEKDTQGAIQQYEYVYQTSHTQNISDANINSRDRLKKQLYDVDAQRSKALQTNQEMEYLAANERYLNLQDSLMALSYSELSPNSIALQREIQRIQNQITQLDQLRVLAVDRNSPDMIERIDDLREKLSSELEDARELESYSILGVNYYDEHPHARKESFTEDQNKKITEMRLETETQQTELRAKLQEIEAKKKRARSSKNYKELVLLDIQRDRYSELLRKYDFMNTITYEMEVVDSEIDLQKWSNYGAFGIANVNFSVRQDSQERVAYYSDQIITINRILNNRKTLLDYKIALIDGEINFMTRKVRRQERLRERAELDRKFEESYFDTHTSEFQESETSPPDFDEEEEVPNEEEL
jgi:phosphatidylserine decarboxylase